MKLIPPTDTGKDAHRLRNGNPPNLNGRKRGARARLPDAFMKDMLADWQEHGRRMIEEFREARPHEYVKLVASLIPRHFNIKVSALDHYTDEQLDRQFDAIAAELESIARADREDTDPAASTGPALPVPALPETA